MSELIGARMDGRHSCGDYHLPNCYNPGSNLTACACGERWWRGHVGTWHSRHLIAVAGETATGRPVYEALGWDRYFLHAAGCSVTDVLPNEGHICGDAESMTAAEAFGGAA
ncbi:MAG TPA: hypothetical protein VFH56_11090 [Acidimicrobiales bacterium]|nr:hypothetical protein [Acidimicrobiales bacterium]